MNGINAAIARVERLDLPKVVKQSITATKATLEQLQQVQMYAGKNSAGKPIGIYKSSSYAKFKHKINPWPGFGVADLRFRGDFYKGIFTKIMQSSVLFFSKDSKAKMLTKKYGGVIWTLNRENSADYAQNTLKPEALKRIGNELR